MDDILLVKGAAIEASPSFTITGGSCTSLSISFRNFCSFAREPVDVILELFLGPLFVSDIKLSFFGSSRFSVTTDGLDKIATPTREKERKTSIFKFYHTLFVKLTHLCVFQSSDIIRSVTAHQRRIA